MAEEVVGVDDEVFRTRRPVPKRCQGVTLSQFFQEGNSENLTEKQKEVLGIWNDLSTNEQETVMSMLRGLRK